MTNFLLEQFKELTTIPGSVPKLREIILQLAVQGSLTADWRKEHPDVEPASVLVEKIKKKRTRLEEEGKIKKQKPLPAITPEEVPFTVPESWEWVRPKQIGLVNPRNYNISDEINVGFVPMRLVPRNLNERNQFEIKKWREVKKGFTHIANGDVCIAKITPCFENGKGKVIVGLPNQVGAATTELLVLRLFSIGIYNMCLFYFYKSNIFRNKAIENMTGTAGQKRLPKSYFESTPLPLPPLSEQQEIVNRVDRLMEQCELLEKSRQKEHRIRGYTLGSSCRFLGSSHGTYPFDDLWNWFGPKLKELVASPEDVKQLRDTVLQLAVQGRLTADWRKEHPDVEPASVLVEKVKKERKRLEQEGNIKKQKPLPEINPEEAPFEVPESWEWVRLGEVGKKVNQEKPKDTFTYIDVNSIDENNGKLKSDLAIISPVNAPVRARKKVIAGDVIFSTVRPYLKNVAIINSGIEPEPISSTAFAVVRTNDITLPSYLHYYLRSGCFIEYTETKMIGMAYPAISEKFFFMGIFPLPPISEQQEIVNRVDRLMKQCDRMEEELKVRFSLGEKSWASMAASF